MTKQVMILPPEGPSRSTPLATARWLVEQRGFSVIPVDGKVPCVSWKEFQERRPTDGELQDWFGSGRARNLGIVTGTLSGVVAVDFDSPEALAWADANLPATPMATTTAKGEHRYYRHPGVTVRNNVKLQTRDGRLDLDVRGDGGYVVAPGSVHASGFTYARSGSWPPIAELPRFDPTWIAAPSASAPANHRPAHDRQQILTRARAYLKATPPAIEGAGGDDHTFKVSCRLVRGFELSDAEALDLLREWNSGCDPRWTDADLVAKIDGARKYGTEPYGARAGDPVRPMPKVATFNTVEDGTFTYTDTGVKLDDFHAYMPTHTYIFSPSCELWPGVSVNAQIAPVKVLAPDGNPALDDKGKEKFVSATAHLDQHRHVEMMTWAPGLPQIVQDRLVSDGGWIEHPGCATFNLYRPARIQRGDPRQAERWIEHVRRVYPDDAPHLIAWLAQRVQRPHEKINHALVLGGLQGIGKDTLLEPVKQAVGPWNFAEVSPLQLLGRFNGFIKSVIMRVSEARDLGDVNRYGFYEHSKILTAAPPDVIRVDEKNLREYAVFNVTGVVFTSNHKTDGLYLPADDRRHYVTWSPLNKDQFSEGYWTGLWRWYGEGGARHVAAYLTEYDLTTFDPKAPPPKTAAFWDIVDANRAPEDAELADILDALENPAAVTLDTIAGKAPLSLQEWLRDRKSARQIPHRLEAAGYVRVRNDVAKDGLWSLGGRRQVVYARQNLPVRDRISAAQNLGGNQ